MPSCLILLQHAEHTRHQVQVGVDKLDVHVRRTNYLVRELKRDTQLHLHINLLTKYLVTK